MRYAHGPNVFCCCSQKRAQQQRYQKQEANAQDHSKAKKARFDDVSNPSFAAGVHVPNAVEGIFNLTENSGRTQEQNNYTDDASDDSVRGLASRLNQVLNGPRTISPYKPLDFTGNLTSRGFRPKG